MARSLRRDENQTSGGFIETQVKVKPPLTHQLAL